MAERAIQERQYAYVNVWSVPFFRSRVEFITNIAGGQTGLRGKERAKWHGGESCGKDASPDGRPRRPRVGRSEEAT